MTAQQTELQRAEQLISSREYPQALAILRTHWLQYPQDRAAVRLLSRLMKALGKTELSGALYKLSETEEALQEDVQNLFEAGFKLIDERELQLAIMLLQRCAQKMPQQPVVTYELGFALMSLHRFEEAIPYFVQAADITNDFDTKLNLCVCYTLTRNLDQAHAVLEEISKLASNEEEEGEVAHRKVVLKRLDLFRGKQAMTPRDWLYTLYGSILLHDPPMEDLRKAIRRGAFPGIAFDTTSSESVKGGYKDVAWTLMVLQKVLMELGYEFDVIEFYSPLSRPLAEAMGHMMELPVRSFGGEDTRDRALMMMAWAPNIIGPHKSFVANSRTRMLFSYGLSTLQPLPLTPDVVGELSPDCSIPWAESSDEETQFRPNAGFDLPDTRQSKAMDRILEELAELESRPDIIKQVQQTIDYYEPKRRFIVAGNPQHFPNRPEYSAEIVQ